MINFEILEEDLENATIADEKYQRENSAKFRAVEQRVATYDEFRDLVKTSHLRPLDKKEKLADPNGSKNVIWNSVAMNKEGSETWISCPGNKNKKHFTEK